MIEVIRYDKTYQEALISLLKKEKDWDSFTNELMLDAFKDSLLSSVTWVCVFNGELCGYVRALNDPFGVYISELYVCPRYRNRGCGIKMLNRVKSEFTQREVYVLSDEDKYYKKHGFKKAGSVFEI